MQRLYLLYLAEALPTKKIKKKREKKLKSKQRGPKSGKAAAKNNKIAKKNVAKARELKKPI